ncbi:MAG: hypothetical protein GXY21_10825 [Clostridiaceae bacterium]|nr:hypothetical protein [Clostridiaceae bacterium]
MHNQIYEEVRTKALNRIKHVRNAYSSRTEEINPIINAAINSTFFDIGGDDYSEYSFIMTEVERYSDAMLSDLIYGLLDEYQIKVTPVHIDNQKINEAPILSFIHSEGIMNILYLFKRFGMNHSLPSNTLEAIMEHHKADDYKYISLVSKYPYAEAFNHNNDESDPSRGTHLYSLKHFFDQFFSPDEFDIFKSFAETYTKDVRKYLGLSVTKSLTPYALFNFKNAVDYSIRHFQYNNVLRSELVGINSTQLSLISEQYLNDRFYKALIGKRDYAQSFITAEWLYDSMKTAENIDLTAIAMGYFKAIEQLMLALIALHKNEGRTIKKKKKDEYPYIILSDSNIADDKIDTTLGSLIAFMKFYKNRDLFRFEINEETQNHIIAVLEDIKGLRNGYFHKDNLIDWNYIEKARSTAYLMSFLLLGSYQIKEEGLEHLCIPPKTQEPDYYRLCAYVNFNSDQLFYISKDGKLYEGVASVPDDEMIIDKFGDPQYSGVYFRKLFEVNEDKALRWATDNRTVTRFNQSNLPILIYTGTIKTCSTGMQFSGPEKLLYKNGVYFDLCQDEKPTY